MLYDVVISRTDVEQPLRACVVLEALQLEGVYGFTSLRIASTNLRTIGLSSWWNGRELEVFHDLFIESAPRLDRLIVLEPAGPTRIRIVHAPRLAVLGYASTQCSEIGVGPVVVQVKLALVVPIFLICPVFFFLLLFLLADVLLLPSREWFRLIWPWLCRQ